MNTIHVCNPITAKIKPPYIIIIIIIIIKAAGGFYDKIPKETLCQRLQSAQETQVKFGKEMKYVIIQSSHKKWVGSNGRWKVDSVQYLTQFQQIVFGCNVSSRQHLESVFYQYVLKVI